MADIVTGIAQEIGAQVAGLDWSLQGGGNVFEEDWSSEPDLAVVVRSAAGEEAALGFDSHEQRVQLTFRALPEDASSATALWWAVYDRLHGLRYHDLPDGTHLVWSLVMQGAPVTIGDDGNGRQLYTMNVRCEVRR